MYNFATTLQYFMSHPHVVLTGSRLFGNVTPTSDWDFFMSASEWHKLPTSIQKEFCEQYIGSYLDNATCRVMKHELHPIHVQVIYDAKLQNKCHAQAFLHELPGVLKTAFLATEKHSRSVWWNWAMKQTSKV